MSKLFEKIIFNRLEPIIAENKLIPPHQFGFRSKHSTTQQVHRVVNKIARDIDNKNYCVGIYLDVAKAFDSVWHDGLLNKLRKLLPGEYFHLLKSYLTDRKFYVKYKEQMSDILCAEAGVPQGSVLGPVLYLLYTADIPTPMSSSIQMATFADDTGLFSGAETIDAAVRALQTFLDYVMAWFEAWAININADKTVQVIYTNRQHVPTPLEIRNTAVQVQQEAKYLGFTIDSKLKWKSHIVRKKNEAKYRFGNLYWLLGKRSQLSIENKLLIYKSIIAPIWKYGIEIWGTAAKSNLNILQRLQSKILRTIVNAEWYITNDDIHRDLGIKTVHNTIRQASVNHINRLLNHQNKEIKSLPLNELTSKKRLKCLVPSELALK